MQKEDTDKKKNKIAADIPKVKEKHFPFSLILTSILFSLIISLSCIAGYHHYIAPRIVTVDLKGYVREQRNLFLANQIGQEDLRKNLDKMEEIITSLPKNNIVFSRDAVLRNARVIELK
ncbi:MAG: hypothetical protein JXB42_07620 [Deltaproteobacteria bacterium]|nr:hypothetical protein [Deltaproteobacteria bacterium]